MPKLDQNIFLKYIQRCTKYFEFGSGGSTRYASWCGKNTVSVESDLYFHQKLQRELGNKDIEYRTIDLKTRNKLGYPGYGTTIEDWIKYSRAYQKSDNADLILIDGRFRVACALNIFDKISDSAFVVIDDYITRKQYHKVEEFYEMLEHGHQLAVFQKRNVLPPSQDLLRKYEAITI